MKSGYSMADADSNLFIKANGVKMTILLVYIGDLIINSDNEANVRQIKANLVVCFQMKKLRELRHFLGLEVDCTKDYLFLYQQKYAKDLLQKFGMLECKPISTPVEVNAKLCAHEDRDLKDGSMY